MSHLLRDGGRAEGPFPLYSADDGPVVTGVSRDERYGGEGAIETCVSGPVDFAHAAGTERRLDFVRTEPSAGTQTHFFRPAVQFNTIVIGDLRVELRTSVAELRTEIAAVRGEMVHRSEAAAIRGEIADLRRDMNGRFVAMDQKFAWLVGIQGAGLVAVVGALVGSYYR